jgi:hypothetical protein
MKPPNINALCASARILHSSLPIPNPATGGRTTLPDWGPRDLKGGTLRAAVRELGLAWQVFEEA